MGRRIAVLDEPEGDAVSAYRYETVWEPCGGVLTREGMDCFLKSIAGSMFTEESFHANQVRLGRRWNPVLQCYEEQKKRRRSAAPSTGGRQ